DALAADLQRGVVREQLRQLRPLRLVDEVAVGALQALDLVHVFQTRDARLQFIQLRAGLRHGRRSQWQGGSQGGVCRPTNECLVHCLCAPNTLSSPWTRSTSGLPVTGWG